MVSEPCNRHDEITVLLKDHETRLSMLERADVKSEQQFVSVFNWLKRIEQGINGINKLIIGAMGSIILILLGFFFWFVQNIGRFVG